jgi:hypothetical protein
VLHAPRRRGNAEALLKRLFGGAGHADSLEARPFTSSYLYGSLRNSEGISEDLDQLGIRGAIDWGSVEPNE